MDWIITNPLDAFVLAWSIGLKYSTLACLIIAVLGFIALRTRNTNKRKVIRRSLCFMLLASVAMCGCGVYRYLCSDLGEGPAHEYYAPRFNDVQSIQIVAARKYGISPLKDRKEAENLIKEGQLKHIRSCKSYQLAPMGHSVPYLTDNGAELLSDIGKSFRDSLKARGLGNHKIVVTSILRTDADVEKLMKRNSVAVKNSAHRHATTFDISYTRFIPDGLFVNVDSGELKKVLAEVLTDLRNDKRCYVRYEKSQNCFHITVRK